ncbi:MAG: flagellar biosynthesis repressor FlbT [Sphingomonas sp.]
MALNIVLRPGEKVIVNGAVLSAVGRTRLSIENRVSILRGREIMAPEEATTPARQLYFATMMAYIDEEHVDSHREALLAALRTTIAEPGADAATGDQIKVTCARFASNVAVGAYYQALADCRQLMELEAVAPAVATEAVPEEEPAAA